MCTYVYRRVCAHLCTRVGLGHWGLVRTAQLSASPTEKDEFDIPDLTDNSRRQLFRTKSKRRFFFRVSEEQKQQQRRCACAMQRLSEGSHSWGRGEAQAGPGGAGRTERRRLRCPDRYTLSACREMLKDPFVRSKLISPPTNFNHLVHVGPTDGRPSAKDLTPVSPLEPIRSLPGETEPITGLSSALEAVAGLCLPGTGPPTGS